MSREAMPGRWPLNIFTAVIDAVPIVFRESAEAAMGNPERSYSGRWRSNGSAHG
jgi:hypothetical protein